MTDRQIVHKPRRTVFAVVVIVIAVFQIVLGTLSFCAPVLFFSGIPDRLLAWQEDWQSKLPRPKGQPVISQLKIQKSIHERIPWLRTFERLQHGSSLVLSVLMLAGGVGLLYLRPWARRLSILWAILSICFTLATTTLAVAYITPATMEVTTQIFEEMPAPPPGQPDIRPMMKSMMQSMGPLAVIGPVFVALILLAYAIAILVLLLRPSCGKAFHPSAGPPDDGSGSTARGSAGH